MDVFNMYLKGVIELKAEESLQSMVVVDYPKLKQENRKKVHKRLYKLAFPLEHLNPKNLVKFGDIKKALNG